jgi:hypothetical protein
MMRDGHIKKEDRFKIQGLLNTTSEHLATSYTDKKTGQQRLGFPSGDSADVLKNMNEMLKGLKEISGLEA